MSAASRKYRQQTLLGIDEFTSSLASPDGTSPFNSPTGHPTVKSGPDPAHASHLVWPDPKQANSTHDTSGQKCDDSSPSANLQRSLENRLLVRLAESGSPEYALTWKSWDIPSGPQICALRASALRTSDNACSGWPTVTARDHKDGASQNSVPINALLGRMCWTAGPMPNSSTATTENVGVLNPNHGRWLMGYPSAWAKASPNYADYSAAQEAIASRRSEDTETL